jgi:hypothetical protein
MGIVFELIFMLWQKQFPCRRMIKIILKRQVRIMEDVACFVTPVSCIMTCSTPAMG